jgi:hypothetical protein
MAMKSELQRHVWEIEEIEKETSSLPRSEMARIHFNKKRIEILRSSERKLHKISETEKKVLKRIGDD